MGSDKKAVLTLVAKSTVGASAQETFKLIAHLPDQTWNSFTPRIKPSQSPSTSSSDHEPPEYPIGTKITLKVGVILPIPIYQREKISIWETRSRKIAWKQNVLPDWLLETDRVQSVHPILDDTGNETCEYVTEMVRVELRAKVSIAFLTRPVFIDFLRPSGLPSQTFDELSNSESFGNLCQRRLDRDA
jgi:hypothetical protein